MRLTPSPPSTRHRCISSSTGAPAAWRGGDKRLRCVAGLVSASLHALLAGGMLLAGHAVYSQPPRLAGNSPELIWSTAVLAGLEPDAETTVVVTPEAAQVDRQQFVNIALARLRPTLASTPLPLPELPASEVCRRELQAAAPATLPAPANVAVQRERSLAAMPQIPELVPGHENLQAAAPRSAAPPAYPDEARRRGWQGRVVLRAHVSAAGTVTAVEVIHPSGYAVLDAAAAAAVRGWTFYPARRGETAVSSTVRIPVEFKL